MKNHIKKIAVIIFLLFIAQEVSFAADQAIQLKLRKEKISPGKQTQLELTFLSTSDVPPPEIPFIDGLNIKFLKSATPSAGSVTHIYTIIALKPGSFKIGPLTFENKGVTYTSDIVYLAVEKEEPVSRRPVQAQNAEMDMSKHISLVLNLPRSTIFVNEKVPITVSVYSDWLDLENINLSQEPSEHLIAKKFDERTVNIVDRDGTKYAVLEYRSSLFAVVPGEYTLAPVEVKMDVARQKAEGKAEVKLLNDNKDLYDEFIGPSNSRPYELKTQPFNITVLPLPTDQQPAEFKGAVGVFDFDAGISPARIRLGDIVTLKMTVTGSGNYDTVRAPDMPKVEGIKVYEPQATRAKDSMVYEQALRVQSAEVKEIPEAAFAFFDPEAKRYVSIRKGPFSITIEGVEAKKPVKEMAEVKKPEVRIVDIKESPGRIGAHDVYFYRAKIFQALAAFPIIFIIASIMVHKRLELLRSDPQYAALLSASRKARRGIKDAGAILKRGNAKDFYDVIFKVMQGYLGERSLMPTAGVTAKVLDELAGTGMDKEIGDRIKKIFSECYLAKYATADLKEEDMASILEEIKYVIKYLDKKKFNR